MSANVKLNGILTGMFGENIIKLISNDILNNNSIKESMKE